MFDGGFAKIMVYPIETVLAEKLETVLSRGVATTRVRDFYDIYELWRVKRTLINTGTLEEAIEATCERRNSLDALERWSQVIETMRDDEGLVRRWKSYIAKHSYAQGMTLNDAFDAVGEVAEAAVGSKTRNMACR